MTIDYMKKITDRMRHQLAVEISVLEVVDIRHDIQGEEDDFIQRIVVDGRDGPWVSKHSIAANGAFRATTEHYREYFGLPLPRLFFVLAIQHHTLEELETELRQLAEGPQGPTATDSCSSPAPGVEGEGSETGSSPTPPVGGEPVPRHFMTKEEFERLAELVQKLYGQVGGPSEQDTCGEFLDLVLAFAKELE